MKEKFQNKYIAWGITAFIVLCAVILVFFAFYRSYYIFKFLDTLLTIVTPIIYGMVIAYITNPIVKFFENKLFKKILKKDKIKNVKLPRACAITATTFLVLGALVAFFSFLLPEVVKSLEMLVENINIYLSNSKAYLLSLFKNSESITAFIDNNYSSFSSFLNDWLNDGLINDMLTHVSNSIFGFLKFLYNFIIGYIISIYVLYDKEKFKAQYKKILYTLFSSERVNLILENDRYTDRVFGDFFTGKLIDSLIIGILCFICMIIFGMPYALIISVIVGVTNIIPYFGPFIGAIPSAFLILLVEPSECIPFLIFIFILQQIDGNIIGPKILGSKTGLSSFWVLCSLLLFGGLFGMVGMIIGVPIFCILYSSLNNVVKRRLEKKNLPVDSKDYENLDSIDENGKLIYSKDN